MPNARGVAMDLLFFLKKSSFYMFLKPLKEVISIV